VTVARLLFPPDNSPDIGHLEPMVRAVRRELEHADVIDQPRTVIADAGYWHKKQIENIVADGIQVLVPPNGGLREGTRPAWDGGLYAFMRRILSTEHGQALYRKRKLSIEPVVSCA
jgi:hypothetical protein